MKQVNETTHVFLRAAIFVTLIDIFIYISNCIYDIIINEHIRSLKNRA